MRLKINLKQKKSLIMLLIAFFFVCALNAYINETYFYQIKIQKGFQKISRKIVNKFF